MAGVFIPRKQVPSKGDTYFKYYLTKGAGGYSTCIVGSATQTANVLNNCVGYAWGRYNEIRAQILGSDDLRPKFISVGGNAKSAVDNAQAAGMAVGKQDGTNTPAADLGAIVCWRGGERGGGDYGHVAVVEEILDENTIKISHSGYGSFPFQYNTLKRTSTGWYATDCSWLSANGSGKWKYYFNGFVYNKAVSPGIQSVNADAIAENTLSKADIDSIYADVSKETDSMVSSLTSAFKVDESVQTDLVETNINSTQYIPKATDLRKAEERTAKLLSSPTLVEVPFISITIGDYTFGTYKENEKTAYTRSPNHVDSIQVTKINGELNVYTFTLKHVIQPGTDPNFVDKIFSSVADTRTIKISYGDLSLPSSVYRDETAIITKVTSRVDFSTSVITYTVSATSDQLQLKTLINTYEQRVNTKPSSVIDSLIKNKASGLTTYFPGLTKAMQMTTVFPTDDLPVTIEKKAHISTLDYLNFLVSCMKPASNSKSGITASGRYMLYVEPDENNEYGGAYFRIVKVSTDPYATTNENADSAYSCYEVDVGYPGNEMISNFSLKDEQEFSILYKYSEKIDANPYVYKFDDNGNKIAVYSPGLTTSAEQYRTTNAQKSWWTNMTQFPVQAILTLRCILQPLMLASYIRVNAFFYGIKHTSSGLYIVTKQVDSISMSGCRTELTLLRIAGDNEGT